MNEILTQPNSYDSLAQQVTDKADEAIGSARKAADGALDSLQQGASHLAAVAPGTLSRVAAQVDELTRQGIERAKAATGTARDQAVRVGDRTVTYIKDEPVKSVLIAAAAGAGLAALIGWIARSNSTERR